MRFCWLSSYWWTPELELHRAQRIRLVIVMRVVLGEFREKTLDPIPPLPDPGECAILHVLELGMF